jgi:hydrogenase-4 component B
MNPELIIIIAVSITGAAILSIPLVPARSKSFVALIAVVLTACITSIPAIQAVLGNNFSFTVNGGSVLGDILFSFDPLSAWFILIINFTLINGAIFGTGYMMQYVNRKNELSLHWTMFVLFHISMILVCMLRNSMAFLIAWEIMTLSSLILVLFDYAKANTIKAGLNYLIQMHIGVAFLTLAFIWVFAVTGSTDFNAIASYLTNNHAGWIIILFFLGFGIKAGFVPLHTWLPYAHPAAPSHVSGVMSGVIVKMGIYGILRFVFCLESNTLNAGVILLIISAVTTLYGILNASVHRDFKKMLAFCTTENMGIAGMGIGMALIGKGSGNVAMMVLGMAASLLHVLNHSLYKSLLFFTVGNIYMKTHTRNMELLGGLIRYMPQTAGLFLVGSLAIGGIPPLNGFVSKFLIYSGFIASFKLHNLALSALIIICTAILSMAGGVSMLTFTKAFGTIFLGEPRVANDHAPAEVSFLMRLPLYLIITVMLAIGLFPNLFLTPVFSIIQSLMPGTPLLLSNLTTTIASVGRASLLLIGLIALLLLVRKSASLKKKAEKSPTWGCGYASTTPAMQYTGKSFSKSLAKLFGFITIENKKYKELQTSSVFPSPRTYVSMYLEFFETRIIEPFVKTFLNFLGFFKFIHNGRTQLYVLYGFLFMIVLIMLSLLNML